MISDKKITKKQDESHFFEQKPSLLYVIVSHMKRAQGEKFRGVTETEGDFGAKKAFVHFDEPPFSATEKRAKKNYFFEVPSKPARIFAV